MPAWLQRHPLIVALCVVAALLVIAIGLEAAVGTRWRDASGSSAPRKAVSAEAKLLPPAVAMAPEQAYPETAARPLFTPTRRPAPEAAAVAQGTLKRDQFVLQGVTIAGEMRIAMLREKANGRIHRVERGREVNGIKVAEIQPETVTLAQGGEQEVLALSVQKGGAAPGAPQQGPFAPVGAGPGIPPPQTGMPGAPPPAQPPPQPANVPAGTVPGGPGSFFGGGPGPMPPTGQAGQAAMQPGATPMTPEELLARRRARRSQQNQ